MKIVNSYNVEINVNKAIKDTVSVYREAVTFLIDVYSKEWTDLSILDGKAKNNYAEKLVHSTKDNPHPIYDFDRLFYKFPSYLRRSAIQDALGIVSSYYSNLDNYNKERYNAISNGRKFNKKAPKLSLKHYKCPALYKGNMFIRTGSLTANIKIFKNNDWIWLPVNLNKQDINYIEKYCKDKKELSPILVTKGRKSYLKFIYEHKINLNNKNIKDQKILAVDLGLNHSAVCSVMDSYGTVTNRLFINQPVEKDRMNHLLNRLRLKQKQSPNKAKMPKIWAKINGLNTHIINDTVNKIVSFAKQNEVDTIVFEYLNFKGKKPKQIAMRLQMWAKRNIQNKVEHKAHSNGIRVNKINCRNTSNLAFDGSGKVQRNKSNASLCTFATGKQYNCDLNATYNIGARYYIREINKTISEKKWLLIEAKVPLLARRTQSTLSTLLELNKALMVI